MQAVIAMGDHDSFADFGRAARAAARSKRVRTWVLGVLGIALSWLAAFAKGWEASIVYRPRIEAVERRVGVIEDAGVAIDVEVAETVARAAKEQLDKHIEDEVLLERERYRNWLRSMVTGAALDRALRAYETELGRGYDPHIAADRALGYSRPPGR
jgi:hypothetical protein